MNGNVLTPLRYPGGKSLFTEYFKTYIECNHLFPAIYIEPYCGGSGAGISLLLGDKVEKILLNDADFYIYSFWYSMKHYGDEFLELFDNTKVTLEEWKKQKLIFLESKKGNVDNILLSGFATFFVNRCNY